MEGKRWFTCHFAAKETGISKRSISYYCRQGKIKWQFIDGKMQIPLTEIERLKKGRLPRIKWSKKLPEIDGFVNIIIVAKLSGISRNQLYTRIYAKTPEFQIPFQRVGKNTFIPQNIASEIINKRKLPEVSKGIHKRKPSKIIIKDNYFIVIANNTGNEFLFDLDMLEIISGWAWHENEQGYLRGNITIKGKSNLILAHNMVLGTPINISLKTDHIDRNTYDNRRNNLRIISNALNAVNSPKRINNTAGYKGVMPHKVKRAHGPDVIKWRAKIRVDNKDFSLGLYDDPKDAAMAYDEAAIKYFGEYALTNQKQGLLN